MKLLLFSDVHRDLEAARRLVDMAHDVDAVVAAGDFAVKHAGLQETIDVLAAIDRPTIAVAGNGETPEALRAASAGWDAVTVCHGETVERAGHAFFGLGGGIPPTGHDWSFDLTDVEAAERLAACPEGAVLVVHSPPRGFLDGADGTPAGSVAILETITTCRPPLAVCGHIHACWGQEATIGPTRLINPGPRGRVVEVT